MGEHINTGLKDLHTKYDGILYIYTDGSRLIENKVCLRVSSGAVFVLNNEIIDYAYSESPDPKDCESWNVGGEMNAGYMGLKRAYEKYSSNKRITMVCDYEGVSKWTTGEWKITKKAPDSVQQLRDLYLKMLEGGWTINWLHIYSHTNEEYLATYYNDQTDKLAGNSSYVPRNYTDFKLYFEITEDRMVRLIALKNKFLTKYLCKEVPIETFIQEYIKNTFLDAEISKVYEIPDNCKEVKLSSITPKTRKGYYVANAY